MSLDIKHLALQVQSRVWHPTCTRKGRRQQGSRRLKLRFSGLRCVSASWHGDHRLLLYFVFGDAIKITQHARFGVLEWSPQTLPQTWRKFL
jgi:hypothetical protein